MASTKGGMAEKAEIVVGADGFGADLKDAVVAHLVEKGHSVTDLGTDTYYQTAADVARRVQGHDSVKGMLFCGTGMGVGIIANKFSKVSAATCENVAAARASRSINDSNVLALGGLVTSPADARSIVDAWLEQEHGKPPVAEGETPPDWWTSDVEAFLEAKWPDIEKIEADSRSESESS